MGLLRPDHRRYIRIYSGVGGNTRVPVDDGIDRFPGQGGPIYVFSMEW